MRLITKLLNKGFFIIGIFYYTTVLGLSDGDWTQNFILKQGGFILHTPTEININNSLIIGSSININGLYLSVDMTRREFINTLVWSGLIDLADYASNDA